jgi:hypothetical protein
MSDNAQSAAAAKALPWIRGAGFISLLAFVWLLHLLSQSGSPTRSEAFFLIPSEEDPVKIKQLDDGRRPVSLVPQESGADGSRYTLELRTGEARRLLASPRIALEIEAKDPAWIVSARLVSRTGLHEITGEQRLEGARTIDFVLVATPDDLAGDEADLRLEVVTRSPAQLSLRAQRTKEIPLSRMLWTTIDDSAHGSEICSLAGRYELPGVEQPLSKAELLACTWGFGPHGARVIHSVVITTAALWLTGLLLLRDGNAYRVAMASGFLAAAIYAVYAVLSPPFQGPDEPDHVLTFAQITGGSTLASGALDLASISHFERIKFRPEEKYSSLDVGIPLTGPWAAHVGAPPAERSPLARGIWQALGGLTAGMSAGSAILVLRLFNAIFAALFLTAALLLAVYALRDEGVSPLTLAAPALLVPGIAYFGVMVSNYAFLVAGFIVQAVAFGLLWQGMAAARQSAQFFFVVGGLAGSGAALAATAADNGIVSLVFWGVILPISTAVLAASNPWSRVLWLPGAFGLAMMLAGAGVAASGPDGLSVAPRILNEWLRLHAPLPSTGHFMYAMYFLSAYLLAVAAAVALVVLVKRWLDRREWSGWGRTLYISGVAVLVVGVLLGVAPAVDDIQTVAGKPPLADYTGSVLWAFTDGFGPGPADWYVVNHFWGSLGWLDTVLPDWLLLGLRLGAGLGIGLLLAAVWVRGAPAGSLGLMCASLTAVLAVLLAVLALYHSISINVHGRYLIGVYVFVLVLAAEGYRRLFSDALAARAPAAILVPAICLLAAGIQAASWTTIVNRYLE